MVKIMSNCNDYCNILIKVIEYDEYKINEMTVNILSMYNNC